MVTVTEQVELRVASLRAVYESGRTRSLDWRKEQLKGIARMLVEEEKSFLDALEADLGKSKIDAYISEIGFVRNEIKHTLRNLHKWAGIDRVMLPLNQRPGKAEIRREPLGSVLVIAPWNYPLQLLLAPMVAAISAGNTVMGKPSELAPHTSAALVEALPNYTDDGVQLYEGGIEEAKALLATRWDHIFYTGSGNIASQVLHAAADHLTPVTLELGGKSPAIVHRSADLAVTARRLVWAKFMNVGQTCVAPDYVLVQRQVADELVDLLVANVDEFYGLNAQKSKDYGRVINHRHLRRLKDLIADIPEEKVVLGGQVDEQDLYFSPTIVVDPDPNSALMGDEIFGPILPVITVESLSEAINFVKARPHPLASYVFAGDNDAVEEVLSQVTSGGAAVNHAVLQLTVPELPFGGVGDSGMGSYHGRAGFETFTHRKSVLHKAVKPDVKLLYPPYGRLKRRLLRKLV